MPDPSMAARLPPLAPPPNAPCYAICGTPRTGGNLLAGLLRAVGRGDPAEFLRADLRRHLTAAWVISEADYLPQLWARMAAGEVFGIKVHWNERRCRLVSDWSQLLPPNRPARWVFQTREDTAAQALSLCRARMTNGWFRPSGLPVEVTEEMVEAARRRIDLWNGCWRRWFRLRDVAPFEVRFEELVARPGRVLDEVLGFLA